MEFSYFSHFPYWQRDIARTCGEKHMWPTFNTPSVYKSGVAITLS